jgi:hypothetical protein
VDIDNEGDQVDMNTHQVINVYLSVRFYVLHNFEIDFIHIYQLCMLISSLNWYPTNIGMALALFKEVLA